MGASLCLSVARGPATRPLGRFIGRGFPVMEVTRFWSQTWGRGPRGLREGGRSCEHLEVDHGPVFSRVENRSPTSRGGSERQSRESMRPPQHVLHSSWGVTTICGPRNSSARHSAPCSRVAGPTLAPSQRPVGFSETQWSRRSGHWERSAGLFHGFTAL